MAIRRLQSTVKRVTVLNLREQYEAVFNEWLADGVIERVPANEEKQWGHYLPHRPVIKENSTTKIRPVFDASAKDGEFPALNECLQKGSNFIELLASNLLRFREGNIGVISDIRRAFLQISVAPEDRDNLRFLWIDQDGNVIMYRHCRVVFGVCSSPFILGVVIKHHLTRLYKSIDEFGKVYFSKENIERLMRDLYVDNCVTSVNSTKELREFRSDAEKAMMSAHFDLRGWVHTRDDSSEEQTAVLGILWNKQSDFLSVNASGLSKINLEKITKRLILSVAHRVFDPLGIICPATLDPRILLQEACTEGLSWDVEVSAEIKEKFLKWTSELTNLSQIKVPRCMLGEIGENDDVTLHTFCDASKRAYAAVTFLRVQRRDKVEVHFVQAKNRVAPKGGAEGRTSIPRLELLAATIGARLAKSIIEAMTFKRLRVFYWSDSSTVLAWIRRDVNWSVFVSNRIKEIREITKIAEWRHVPGSLNPADLPSRGCSVKQLLTARWWKGPEWLHQVAEQWPMNECTINENEVGAEIRKSANVKLPTLISLLNNDKNKTDGFLTNYSSFVKITRIVAWIKRFIFNCKKDIDCRLKGDLTAIELENAEFTVLKLIQREFFENERDERIRHFAPFKDENNLLRMKSKIFNRDDTFNFRCPIILPDTHELVKSIILSKHVELNHAGVTTTLNVLREKFWILGGRKVIRSVINKCVNCRRYDAKHLNETAPPLPLNRTRDAAIFEVVGIDFAGPIHLKGGQKAWICLFTCAVFRAVHLELVKSLNVASLLMAIRRHIARRGRPTVIYSDCGTNFVGLNNALNKVNFEKLKDIMSKHQIEWRFNPPASPWWGGFWERPIGVLKRLLRRTLKKASLDYEEMLTILCDCESIVNSRPLTFMSDSKDDFIPLTPNMFLQEIKEIGVLDLDQIEKCQLNKRYEYRQKIRAELRLRFRNEYLGALAYSKSKCMTTDKIKVGDIVLIGNDNAKRLDWPLARVKELIYSNDNKVRVVKLVTGSGELTRPIQRLFPLEINYNANDSDFCDPLIKNIDVVKNKLDNVPKPVTVTRSGRLSKEPERLTYYN